MTDPIISPWFIYFLGIADGLKGFLIGGAVVTGIILFIGAVVMIANREFGKDDNDYKTGRAIVERLRWIFPTLLLLAILVPSKGTLIGMVVAKNVTYQNVEKAIKAGKSVKDVLKKDMLDIIDSIRGEEEKVEQ